MQIIFNGKSIVLDRETTVAAVLRQQGINPETVLVKRKGELVLENEKLKEGDAISTVNVISGG